MMREGNDLRITYMGFDDLCLRITTVILAYKCALGSNPSLAEAGLQRRTESSDESTIGTKIWDVPAAHPMMSRTLTAPHTRGVRASCSHACCWRSLIHPAQKSTLRRPCSARARSPRESPPRTSSWDASGVCLRMQATVTQ